MRRVERQLDKLNASGAVQSTAPAAEWGGYLFFERDRRVFEIKLTGRLSRATVNRIHRTILGVGPTDGPTFLILDASHLGHIPLDVAEQLQEMERLWRRRDVVTLWSGLSPYLANLLVLASSSCDLFPAFVDPEAAMRAVRAVASDAVGRARLRLDAWGGLRH